jgi:transposase
MASVVEAYQAMRGVSFIVAVTFTADIGDVRRFDNPRQLMSFVGLVPAEARPARRYAARGSSWPAIAALVGSWSKPPGPTVIPPGSARPS